MSPPWIIEIDDIELRLWQAGARLAASPGAVCVTPHAVLTGSAAAARRFDDPRALHDRHWQQLNTVPLTPGHAHCRHHADLAYHHLAALCAGRTPPDTALCVVPAHYQADTLALLLGITAALALPVHALVDPAVAALAGCAAPGRYAVVQLQQHDACVVTVDVGDTVERRDVQVVEPAGRLRILAALRDLSADALLDQARFDPLHDAASEALLHAALPHWLARAARSDAPQVELVLDYAGRQRSASLARREIERVVTMVLAPLAECLDATRGVVLDATLAELPGVTGLFPGAARLTPTAVPRGLAGLPATVAPDAAGVPYLTSLPAAATPTLELSATGTAAKPGVTHLLHGARAFAIGTQALPLPGAADAAGARARVRRDGARVLLEPHGAALTRNGERVDDVVPLVPGDRIAYAGADTEYRAIHVG